MVSAGLVVNHIRYHSRELGGNVSERVAIVGIGITEHRSKWPERSQVEIVMRQFSWLWKMPS